MPAKRRPRARAARCSYKEGNRRCVRNGAGDPALCAAHRIVLEDEAMREVSRASPLADAIGRMSKGQKVSTEGIIGAIGELFGIFGTRPAPQPPPGFNNPPPPTQPRNVWAEMQEAARRANAQRQHQPPRVDPDAKLRALAMARNTLGFTPTQKLTVDDVKTRRRELAMKHHPDRGGSVTRMQQINAAADALEASL